MRIKHLLIICFLLPFLYQCTNRNKNLTQVNHLTDIKEDSINLLNLANRLSLAFKEKNLALLKEVYGHPPIHRTVTTTFQV